MRAGWRAPQNERARRGARRALGEPQDSSQGHLATVIGFVAWSCRVVQIVPRNDDGDPDIRTLCDGRHTAAEAARGTSALASFRAIPSVLEWPPMSTGRRRCRWDGRSAGLLW